MVEDSRHIFVDEGSIAKGLGGAIQFNFARPKDLNGFIAENKTLWKSHFTKNMDKLGMVNWGVARKIAPRNKNTSTAVTWDMFNTLEDLMNYRVAGTSVIISLRISEQILGVQLGEVVGLKLPVFSY